MQLVRVIKEKSKTKKIILPAVGILSITLLCISFIMLRNESMKKVKVKEISEQVDFKTGKSEDVKSAPKKGLNDVGVLESDNTVKWIETPVKEASGYVDFERPTLKEILEAPKEINKNTYLGKIDIEELNIHTNIFKYLDSETNKSSMLKGAVVGLKKQNLGISNYVLLGHNLGYSGVLFSDLPKAKKGLVIKVTDADVTKRFKVTEVKTVKNTDTSVFNMSKEPKLTLITCDKATATSKRVVVTANEYKL